MIFFKLFFWVLLPIFTGFWQKVQSLWIVFSIKTFSIIKWIWQILKIINWIQ